MDQDLVALAGAVGKNRRVEKDEDGYYRRRMCKARKARSLSILPEDRFDEKVEGVRVALQVLGAPKANNTEIVLFALDLAVQALGVDLDGGDHGSA